MVGSTFAKILDKHCLEGHNFPSWYRNVKILLTLEKIIYVLDKAPPDIPLGPEATEDERAKYDKHVEDDTQAKCYLLASMNEELQRQHEGMDSAFSIILHLTELYGEGTRNRRFNTMIGFIEQLENLGTPLDGELAQDFILASLPDSFSQFVMNYNMNKMDHTLSELLNMLVTAEKTMKENVVGTVAVAYNKPSSSNPKPYGKGKGKEIKSPTPKPKGGVKKKKKAMEPKGTCHHCGKEGHWRRNCRFYLATLKDKPQGMVYVLIFNSNC
ncbi:hypothetical protein D8674_028827 [Pyrus ussuriensis x Pyrus communis]|uniref:CCHC-type domain-containing protein n=1 Tax=Pyrus ussuriensis x Pyrus communis TaxID=2448454 RepID=A0A5N5I4P7_9ROSA|nr:hypothetical protein D8674_028827 [Pyrus ussuriensis x Pyrus communis]